MTTFDVKMVLELGELQQINYSMKNFTVRDFKQMQPAIDTNFSKLQIYARKITVYTKKRHRRVLFNLNPSILLPHYVYIQYI